MILSVFLYSCILYFFVPAGTTCLPWLCGRPGSGAVRYAASPSRTPTGGRPATRPPTDHSCSPQSPHAASQPEVGALVQNAATWRRCSSSRSGSSRVATSRSRRPVRRRESCRHRARLTRLSSGTDSATMPTDGAAETRVSDVTSVDW